MHGKILRFKEDKPVKTLMTLCLILAGLLPSICGAQSTEERLAGMEGTLKQIDKRIDDFRNDVNTRFATAENRMSSLEN